MQRFSLPPQVSEPERPRLSSSVLPRPRHAESVPPECSTAAAVSSPGSLPPRSRNPDPPALERSMPSQTDTSSWPAAPSSPRQSPPAPSPPPPTPPSSRLPSALPRDSSLSRSSSNFSFLRIFLPLSHSSLFSSLPHTELPWTLAFSQKAEGAPQGAPSTGIFFFPYSLYSEYQIAWG